MFNLSTNSSSPFSNIFTQFDQLRDQMLSIFDSPDFPSFDLLPFAGRDYPKSNLAVEKDTGTIRVEMAIPGFKADEIDVEIVDNVLKVTGKAQEKCEEGTYRCKGIATRSFIRKWSLPKNANLDNLEASLEDGILVLRIPMIEEKSEIKKIAVKTSKN